MTKACRNWGKAGEKSSKYGNWGERKARRFKSVQLKEVKKEKMARKDGWVKKCQVSKIK